MLTGAGDKAFCTGGDQKERGAGGYGGGAGIGLDVAGLHGVIRNIPKPVIAMVNGYAIGGGHVLHVLCDLSIAADTAVFGQVGPRVGSVDPGFGTAYLARVVGEKKAREIWYLCRQYSRRRRRSRWAWSTRSCRRPSCAPRSRRGAASCSTKSPTALKLAKYSFNADTDHIHGITELGFSALELYYQTPRPRRAGTRSSRSASRISEERCAGERECAGAPAGRARHTAPAHRLTAVSRPRRARRRLRP